VGLLRVTQSPARDDQEGRPFRAQDGYGCDCNSRHRLEDPTQMGLAQDQDVVQAFSPDRADEPFGVSVLPG
jgi:hypothetical protein